jgi:hypothetical protein
MIPITLRQLTALFFTLIVLSACNDGDDGIPAYISIDAIELTVKPGQGTASHKITDAWVRIDGELIGAFELPATFPVLKSGSKEVIISAGIKVNGISATRSEYPFFIPFIATAELIPGEITSIENVVVSYDDKTTFLLMENFNGNTISIDTTSSSEVRIQRIDDPELIFHYQSELNQYSAVASLSGDALRFECASTNNYNLPKGGKPVFLEMNYRNDHNLTVGLFVNLQGQVIQHPILVLNPSPEWNKIYVNLTPTISNFALSIEFRIFMGLVKDLATENATIYIDHLKLLY